MFGFKKKSAESELKAPAAGKIIELAETKDPVFSTGAMGQGFGLDPTDGTIYAPISGTVSVVADTKHAIGIQTGDGLEVLLHLGIDTVELKGQFFELDVSKGQKVSASDRLGSMDLEQIKSKGYETTIMTVVTNSADKGIEVVPEPGTIDAGQTAAHFNKS